MRARRADGRSIDKAAANMKPADEANRKSKRWILFWLLGYPIAVVMFVAIAHLKL
jgi:hypothetical protein